MCGIVGHIGCLESQHSKNVVLAGLATLEYRGYDSAGIAVSSAAQLPQTAHDPLTDGQGSANGENGSVTTIKRVGKLVNLREAIKTDPLPDAIAAIGHTRWATHGVASTANAHPHTADQGRLALIHNGIIENAEPLRAALQAAGAHFYSETDTEVVAKLLAANYRALRGGDAAFGLDTPEHATVKFGSFAPRHHGVAASEKQIDPESLPLPQDIPAQQLPAARDLAAALLATAEMLVGAFTLLVVHADCPSVIFAARRSSPLVIGVGEDETVLASDTLAFPAGIDTAIEVGQDQFAIVTASGPVLLDRHGKEVAAQTFPVAERDGAITKGGWATFMEKEINEQPNAIARTLADRTDADGYLTLDELRIPLDLLRRADKMIIVACGTAAYAGHVARYAIEHWCRIPVEVDLAHEFRYRDPVVNEKTLVVAISQSGETMDTIMAIRHAREQGARVIAIVNTPGSTISREADAVLLTHAGPEIAVASTKAFTAQITATYLLGLYLAQVRGNKYVDEVADYLDKLAQMPNKVQQVLDRADQAKAIARDLKDTDSVIYLGRHVGYPIALEGALKIKEIAYIHAEGFAAGELKHGPIALIEEGQVVVIIVPTPRRPELHRKVLSNVREVQARGARTIVIAEEGDEAAAAHADYLMTIPSAPTLYLPLETIVPLQIFACELATQKGLDVDQPRNLAKSVTVE